MPPHLHNLVAADCLALRKPLVTASYASPELRAMHEAALAANLLFLCEMGADPGIDHLSAMRTIDSIHAEGGILTGLYSYAGGLVTPECDNNPWHYKFSWNPRNIIVAGQGITRYLANGKVKLTPYNRLFSTAQRVDLGTTGVYDGYPNRDSVIYRTLYRLPNIQHLLRGTLRHEGFCKSWDIFVQLGMTDDTYPIDTTSLTYTDFLETYLPETHTDTSATLPERLAAFFGVSVESAEVQNIGWLGFFDHLPIALPDGKTHATPADILLALLLPRWVLAPTDRDRVVMHHRFEYTLAGQPRWRTATMVVDGTDSVDTAMSRLVGLPMAIFVKHYLAGSITLRGVCLPLTPDLYHPVLEELETLGIRFEEQEG